MDTTTSMMTDAQCSRAVSLPWGEPPNARLAWEGPWSRELNGCKSFAYGTHRWAH